MATSAQTLVYRTRRYLRDLPLDQTTLSGSITASATSVAVASGAAYSATGNDLAEIDSEIVLVNSVSTNTLTVQRGVYGSTAATHASGATIARRPAFFTVEILDALNQAIQACFPRIYQPVIDTSITLTADTYEYTVPNLSSPAIPIPYISELQILCGGSVPYKTIRSYKIIRGATPKIKFKRATVGGDTLRVIGYGPFPVLADTSASLETSFPVRCEYLLPMFAAASLLMAGEAARVRSDSGMTDDREQANRVGAAYSVGAGLMNRFYTELERTAMPPLGPHVVAVL